MNPEHIKSQIESALDLLQLITEDLESEFISAHVDGAVRAGATIIVSALAILDSYLLNEDGQHEAVRRMEELTLLPRYQRPDYK